MTAVQYPGGIVGGTIVSINNSVVDKNAYWEAVVLGDTFRYLKIIV